MNRGLLVLLPALLVAGSPKAQTRPGFDPQDVLRRVRAHHLAPRAPEPSNQGLDDGEFLVDTTLVYDRSPGYEASVVSDGMSFLVLWSDQSSEVRAMRISQSGQLLDTGGFVVAPPTGQCINPRAAFDGVNYLVVWMIGGDTVPAIRGAGQPGRGRG
jgi:hypothetical protein